MNVTVALPDDALEAIARRSAALVLAELEARGDDRWLSTGEAAEYIGASPRRVRDLIDRGVLAHGKDGSRLLVRRSVLDAYINDDDRAAGAVVAANTTAPAEEGRWRAR